MKYIMKVSEFQEILKYIKAVKEDIILVYQNKMIATPFNKALLRVVQLPFNVSVPFTIIYKNISSSLLDGLTDINIVLDFDINKIYCDNNKSIIDEEKELIYPIDTNIIAWYEDMIRKLPYSIHTNLGYITDDPTFILKDKINTHEGCRFYKNNGYIFSVYSGLLSVNAKDKVTLDVFDYQNTYIAAFGIYKPKLNPIYTFIRYLNLQKHIQESKLTNVIERV